MTGAAVLRRLDLRVRRLLDGRLSGDHASPRLGPGSDPEELVRYRPGEDDVRRIDWNVTARSDEPHVWRPRAERELTTWVLMDASPSMHFGTVREEKVDVARGLTAAIGLVHSGPFDRVGALVIEAGGLHEVRPSTGRRLAHRVVRREPAPRSGAGAPDLHDALAHLHRRHPRPGLRLVISDFLEPGPDARPFAWEAPLRRLAARHDVIVVEVVDPRELDLPDVGPVLLEDPESGERWEVWTSDARLRERYAAVAGARRAAVAAAIRASRCEHVVLRTDRDWVRDLALALRQRPSGRPGRPARRGRSGRPGRGAR